MVAVGGRRGSLDANPIRITWTAIFSFYAERCSYMDCESAAVSNSINVCRVYQVMHPAAISVPVVELM